MLAAVLCGVFLARIRRAHVRWDATLLALFGLPLFSYLLLRSARAYKEGNVAWKGRNYSDEGNLLATGR
jgi:hypothetical protein